MKCRYKQKRIDTYTEELKEAYNEIYMQGLSVYTFLTLSDVFGFGKARMSRLANIVVDEYYDLLQSFLPDDYKVNKYGVRRGSNSDCEKDALQSACYKVQKELSYLDFDADIFVDLDIADKWICTYRTYTDSNESLRKAAWYMEYQRLYSTAWTGLVLLLLNRLFGFGKKRLYEFYGRFISDLRHFTETFIRYPLDRGKMEKLINDGVLGLADKRMIVEAVEIDGNSVLTVNTLKGT